MVEICFLSTFFWGIAEVGSWLRSRDFMCWAYHISMIQFAKIYRMPTMDFFCSLPKLDWRTGCTQYCIHHVKKVVPPTCLAASSANIGSNSCHSRPQGLVTADWRRIALPCKTEKLHHGTNVTFFSFLSPIVVMLDHSSIFWAFWLIC